MLDISMSYCGNLILLSIVVWFLSMWLTLSFSDKIKQTLKKYQLSQVSSEEDSAKDNVDQPNFKHLLADIEKHSLSWYGNISLEPTFTENSKILIEDFLCKLLKACNISNSKLLMYGILNIYLKHLKEFKKSVVKKEKHGGPVDKHYRYTHDFIEKSETNEFLIYQITVNFLNHFINWELRNSLPCHVLDAILSRKLVYHIIRTYSQPKYLNYYVLKFLSSKSEEFTKYTFIEISDLLTDIDENKENEEIKDCNLSLSSINNETSGSQSPGLNNEIDTNIQTSSTNDQKDIITENKSSKIHEQEIKSLKVETENRSCGGSQKSNETNNDPIPSSKSTGKTSLLNNLFNTSPDGEKFESIASSHQSTKDKNLISGLDIGSSKIFNEMKSSIKPISGATINKIQSIKGLHQSTFDNMSHVTSSALHKIGGLQDEAVDVVEGIIDFGKAGFRKGLQQLTSLQDHHPNKTEGNYEADLQRKEELLSKRDRKRDSKDSQHSDDSWIKSFTELPSPSEADQIKDEILQVENIAFIDKTHPKFLPVISMSLSENDSPDPEYEETGDLESTIAKLRSLLQQKSSESSMSTPAVSPMPGEEFIQESIFEVDPFDDYGCQRKTPSFYKLCAKTATGVIHNTLNSIKTALPGNGNETDFIDTGQWTFINYDDKEEDLLSRMKKLLSERKIFCTVDNAYEAVESLKELKYQAPSSHIQIEDDLEDLDLKLPISKLLTDILCELLFDTDSVIIQEPIINLFLLVLGHRMEKELTEKFNVHLRNLICNFQYNPTTDQPDTVQLQLEDIVKSIKSKLLGKYCFIIGEDTAEKAISLFVGSLQSRKMNEDMLLQICEFISLMFVDVNEE